MKPYYDEDGITIYHGDCSEVLTCLPPSDLLLTDPPYGIQAKWVGGFSAKHGWGKAGEENVIRSTWDNEAPSDSLLLLAIQQAREAIIWGGNYFSLPPSRGWLVWNKPERGFSLSEAELAWTTLDRVIRVFDWRRSEEGRSHPTQKPLALMKWCLRHVDSETILDPFMGSGTTLRAAKDLGRKAIGIEIEEKYCEIAAKRMAQKVLF